jgi:hypothetical protein
VKALLIAAVAVAVIVAVEAVVRAKPWKRYRDDEAERMRKSARRYGGES